MDNKVVQLLPPANAYLKRLGLSANPFPVAPDASRYFMTEALEALAYETLFCIQQRKGFIVITGEVGLGKTTFSRYVINQLHGMDASVAVVFNSVLQRRELLEQICHDFGLQPETPTTGRSLRELVIQLNRFFIRERRQGRNCVIFIDDAQNLTTASLETIRVLSNLETGTEKLVQVVLLGQQELLEKLDSNELRQLRSRVALSREIKPLQFKELVRYIEYKLSVTSSGTAMQFTPAAMRGIYRYSAGNLRRANMLLDRVLIGILRDPQRIIGRATVAEAIKDLKAPDSSDRGRRGRWITIVAATGLAGMIVMTGVMYQPGNFPVLSAFWPEGQNGVSQSNTPDSNPLLTAHQQSLAGTESPGLEPQASIAENGGTVLVPYAAPVSSALERDVLHQFLSYHDLQDYTDQLISAYQRGEMLRFRQQLLAPRGLELLRDSGFVTLAGLSRPVLPVRAPDGGLEQWVLWRPEFRVHSLFYGTRSDEVNALQRRLAAAGYYQGLIDGVVGPMTASSLIEFQRAHGIAVSGQVDDVTLLWLHEYELQE
jgi:general secretion pathway protein A